MYPLLFLCLYNCTRTENDSRVIDEYALGIPKLLG